MVEFVKARRVAAYMLDNIITIVMFQIIITILCICLSTTSESIFRDNGTTLSISINILSIAFVFLYYGYFWIQSKHQATLGQMLWNLKLSTRPSTKQLFKRMIFMHVASLYLTSAVIYAQITDMKQDTADKFLLLALLFAIAMQIIYACYINTADKITGIKVVGR